MMSCCIFQNETGFFLEIANIAITSVKLPVFYAHTFFFFFPFAQDGLTDVRKYANVTDHKMILVFLRTEFFISVAKQIKEQGGCCRSNKNIPLCCS